MDPELIAYLDRFERHFAELRQELREETSSLREELASFRQSTESRFDRVETQIQELQTDTRESRVMIEDLYSKVQLVAEGVANNSEVIERLRGEVKKDLADVRSEMRTHDRQSYQSLDVRVTTLEKARKEH